MRFAVLTIFPELFPGPLGAGVVGRAVERGVIEVVAHDLRDYSEGRHRQVDDAPFGGGAGMVLKAEPIIRAVRELRTAAPSLRPILLSPQGRRFDQAVAAELATEAGCLLICGRYQGVDDRAVEEIGEELSLGDFILSGGEVAAMAIIEATARLVPGVVGSEESLRNETFSAGGSAFEPPLYTRPAMFEARAVPEVLRGGNHAAIEEWRRHQSASRIKSRRPDLVRSPIGPGGAL